MRIRLIGSICLLAFAGRAYAQPPDVPIPPPPRVEFAVGITLQTPRDVNLRPLCEQLVLHCSGSGKTFPDFGLSVQPAVSVTTWLALVGEIGMYGNHWRADASASGQRTNTVRFVLTGVRLQSRTVPRAGGNYVFRIFGQLLAGVQASTEVPSGAAVQPGVGTDAFFRNGLGARFTWDYRFVRTEPRDLSGGRAFIGVVIGRRSNGSI